MNNELISKDYSWSNQSTVLADNIVLYPPLCIEEEVKYA